MRLLPAGSAPSLGTLTISCMGSWRRLRLSTRSVRRSPRGELSCSISWCTKPRLKGNTSGSITVKEWSVNTVARGSRPAVHTVSTKQATVCPGAVSKTLKQTMAELVQDIEALLDDQPGHKWELRATTFGCSRCWAKIRLRSGKAVLEKLKSSECRFGRLAEDGLNLRTRAHTTHDVWRRGVWLECQRCGRTSKEQDGRVQLWMSNGCDSKRVQLKLQFKPQSPDS